MYFKNFEWFSGRSPSQDLFSTKFVFLQAVPFLDEELYCGCFTLENFPAFLKFLFSNNPVGIYLLKVKNRITTTWCEIYSKLTRKTPERRHWRRSGVFIDYFEHFTPCSSVSIINFEHLIAGWEAFRAAGLDKYLYVCTYVLEKSMVVQKYFITSTLSYP